MSETDASISTDDSVRGGEKNPAAPSVGIDRAAAIRTMAEARRLYAVAELLQGRRVIGGIDSAVPAERSLSLLLGLLLRLRGDPLPDTFSELVERARAIAAEEALLAEDLGPDLAVVHEMRETYVHSGANLSAADDRRYDRALLRSAEWLGAAQAYVDQCLPRPESRLGRRLAIGLVVPLVFVIGLAIGRHGRPESPPPLSLARPAVSSAPVGPAFAATFYRDTALQDVAFSRRDESIAFDWEAQGPPGMEQVDHFSARWDGNLVVGARATYEFSLTSDDGSRLYVDGALVVDNWSTHGQLTKTGTVDLEQSVHAIRVEFFDEVGAAIIRLEWSSPRFERRLVTAADLR